jgi:prepilin-type N-terminal cleavage/methylation domain-containing protein
MYRLQNVKLNKQGLTLVEVMIALVIMLLVFFALMQTALVGIDANMLNTLRGEAVNVAEIRMNEVRTIPFVTILSDTVSLSGCDCPAGFPSTGVCVLRDVRSISNFKYCSNVTCSDFGANTSCTTDDSDNRQITVTTGWKWKGQDYFHRITTIRKR